MCNLLMNDFLQKDLKVIDRDKKNLNIWKF